jgi:autotransporter-associated beta strand protein
VQRREFQTDDLTLGMRVYTSNLDFTTLLSPGVADPAGSPVRITSIINREVMQAGQPDQIDSEEDTNNSTLPNAWPGYTASTAVRIVQFGPAPARFLTLTGSNTGNNTFAPLVTNPAAADIDAAATTPAVAAAEAAEGYGTVGLRKTGAGKWILTNNNSYTWETQVEEGTLLVNGNQSTATGLTTVSAGAALGGTGTIGGNVLLEAGAAFTAAFSGGTIDPLAILGNLDLSALSNSLSITGSGVGSSWTLLTYAGTLTGTFESTPGYTLDYGSGTNSQITIMAAPGLVGDYNNNGKVDAADYTVWRNSVGDPGTSLVNRDPNNMGVVGEDDYDSWKENFGAMAGSGSLASAAVPEPASLVMVGMTVIAMGFVRRRG